MSFDVGARLGGCEVLSEIGAGGMGKVYKARDTRLGREVAVKVLPEAFAADPERMARLEREARILASLNHPNIAAIFSLEEGALVMEYVEGPTLDERIARGPIPLEEALPIARQMAEALAYAHERGIIHRDLKPANVKLTGEGEVKVLDFGLAKALEGEAAPADPETSPTLTIAATRAGLILGTAAYMSPEQARGKPADKRADIWAFGVVLYEMLAGKRLFDADNVSDTLASVLKEPIDWSPLPAETPPALRKLLRRCLERDRRNRLQDIGDARLELNEAIEGKAEPAAATRRIVLPWVMAAVLTFAAGVGITAWWHTSRPAERPLMRLELDLGTSADLAPVWGTSAILSPDGTRLVHVVIGPEGKTGLATRLLDRQETIVLSGTDGALNPFFSPDSQWVAFFAARKLKKIAITGGAAIDLCDTLSLPPGGSWGEDGSIVLALALAGPLSRVSSSGGTPQPVTQLDDQNGEYTHRWPQVLPGGEAVLFTAGAQGAIAETGSIVVQSFKDGKRKVLQRGAYYGRYLPSGHLVYFQQGRLFAVRFDPGKWELAGAPVPIIEDVAYDPYGGGVQLALSGNGTLIYASGKAATAMQCSLAWIDSRGNLELLPAKPGDYSAPSFSPDGKWLALTRSSGGNDDLWMYEWQRDVMNRLTTASDRDAFPVWSPDGKHIAYTSGRELHWIRADGSGPAKRLTDGKRYMIPFSFTPDGKRLALTESSKETAWDIWTLPLAGDDPDDPRPGQPEPFVRTPFTDWAPSFSPDGRWLAYISNESGTSEVYVRPFRHGSAKWQVSRGGGGRAVWSRTRPELFFLAANGRNIMAATYAVQGESFIPQAPRLWSEKRLIPIQVVWNFDLAPDGNRVIALMPPPGSEEEKPQTRLTFLLNFFDELRRRVPAGGK